MPSGLRQTPLGARKPVARISVRPPSLLTFSSVPWCGTSAGNAVAGGLGVIEIPLGVGLQVHGELVEMLGHLVVVVEILIKVGLAVSVQVVKPDDLVAAADVDLALDDLQPQRLEQARGDPPPGEPLFRTVDALDEPDVAVPGADRRAAALGQEIEAREPELAEPRVGLGDASACRRRRARRRGRSSAGSAAARASAAGLPS